MTTADSIRPTLQAALAASDLVLEDVVVTPAGRRRVVKVLVDRALTEVDTTTERTAPLTLDEVADATHLVSDALDTSDVMGEQPYTLEVSSPGVGRPLTQARHFRRNVGRLVTVQHDGGEVTGRVNAASATDVTLEVPATKAVPARTETLRYTAVQHAVVEVEFSRPDESKES
ncbi:MAG TPA: ribosome maturation factor RimP [Nocardioides sp.]|nr:ribosome maturation factor RimP [Nocardioides sp.]